LGREGRYDQRRVQMRLYQGCIAKVAREVLDYGFVGELWMPLKEDQKGGIIRDETGQPLTKGGDPERWCVFRSGSFGASTGEEDGSPLAVIPEGDFVLMIEVPDEIAKKFEVVERSQGGREREESSSTDREFWLPEKVADRFRDTVKVYDRDGAEVSPDLVGQ
jgi:hypothetical protein